MTMGGPTVIRLTHPNILTQLYRASMVSWIIKPLVRFTAFRKGWSEPPVKSCQLISTHSLRHFGTSSSLG
jgi:hypothetical protein